MARTEPLLLHLVRHGATETTENPVYCGRTDVPLSPAGVEMASAVAERLAEAPLRAIYSSPLDRARSTAAPLAATLGMELVDAPDFIEIDYGEWELRSREELLAAGAESFQRCLARPDLHAPPGGESAADVAERVSGGLEQILAVHGGQEVAVVAHKSSIRVLLCVLLDRELAGFRAAFVIPPGSISTLQYEDGLWTALRLGCCDHIPTKLREAGGA